MFVATVGWVTSELCCERNPLVTPVVRKKGQTSASGDRCVTSTVLMGLGVVIDDSDGFVSLQ